MLTQITRRLPGLAVTLGVTGLALGAQTFETALFGQAWIEALVLAILIGTAVRTGFGMQERFDAGIGFCAKQVLEVAVVLLGASISLAALEAAGGWLVGGIVLVVLAGIGLSYGIGRLLGLHHRLAVLVACGNSICGNSAIAAVAPVIDAEGEDVAASIAFTAALGIVVVLLLPLLGRAIGLDETRFGILAGLTVYAVPQVLAATAPVGIVAAQTGTLVKLVRVLMLGPVVFGLGLGSGARGQHGIGHFLPWFILGFLALMGLRSAGLIPEALVAPLQTLSGVLTIVSMAALGLMVDIRSLLDAGGRVVATAVLSIVTLGLLSLAMMRLIGLV